MAGLRPCLHPRCPTLVPSGRCDEHGGPAKPWHKSDTATPTKRFTGRKLQAARQRLFADDPFCVLCRPQGKLTLATIRDHKVPLAEGGADDETNEQGLCQECSDIKTREESKRGIKANRFQIREKRETADAPRSATTPDTGGCPDV